MALPIVDTPRYELTLPSTDVKVEYRPFLVKEEKVLYMALESGDEKEMQTATKNILSAVTFNKLNVETLPTFDVEYIFLQVRAKSVGEVSKFKIICPDDNTTYGDVEVDISKVDVQVDDAHTNDILRSVRELFVIAARHRAETHRSENIFLHHLENMSNVEHLDPEVLAVFLFGYHQTFFRVKGSFRSKCKRARRRRAPRPILSRGSCAFRLLPSVDAVEPRRSCESAAAATGQRARAHCAHDRDVAVV